MHLPRFIVWHPPDGTVVRSSWSLCAQRESVCLDFRRKMFLLISRELSRHHPLADIERLNASYPSDNQQVIHFKQNPLFRSVDFSTKNAIPRRKHVGEISVNALNRECFVTRGGSWRMLVLRLLSSNELFVCCCCCGSLRLLRSLLSVRLLYMLIR